MLEPGPSGTFDSVAVKDPSIVKHDGSWHMFYTARGGGDPVMGYVRAQTMAALKTAPRYELKMFRGRTRLGCAPQVFYFRPQERWYLIGQTCDELFQPVYATTACLTDPESWTDPQPLVKKEEPVRWIDFWVLCDQQSAYLYFTRDHESVAMCRTTLGAFPGGWSEPEIVYDGVFEAVHIYRSCRADEYHMIFELNDDGMRSFGIACAPHPAGPWSLVAERYADGDMLIPRQGALWTGMVSHGEAIRSECDERMRYDPHQPRWLIQGIPTEIKNEPYCTLPWRIGCMVGSE